MTNQSHWNGAGTPGEGPSLMCQSHSGRGICRLLTQGGGGGGADGGGRAGLGE